MIENCWRRKSKANTCICIIIHTLHTSRIYLNNIKTNPGNSKIQLLEFMDVIGSQIGFGYYFENKKKNENKMCLIGEMKTEIYIKINVIE